MDAKCPMCDGLGWFDAFAQRSDCCSLESVDCHVCKATGKISPERAAARIEGRRRRDDRVARGVNVRDEAARLGITAIELGRIERGA